MNHKIKNLVDEWMYMTVSENWQRLFIKRKNKHQ